ncbi:TetR/AcrR family transcriptional regulator [Promicromonospora iranensis]|uniref:AcrR family transcriptional regulator n=1 Tax=Promicromonospora iranensis TaxID=1105144 RepID=A0ABU2CW55_9MICO|nr:TetR/AcrR family transcriptional regulator [Promicromonospora iranensis]MDR7385587.1 AcrR family transcriptional regulator [Promicromonospora iranensis]
MAGRGGYAKGIAKREEILLTALDVIARHGYRGASVKEIADAVGLSQAGLLHHFDSKEHLFVEVLRRRDELDTATALAAFAERGVGGALDAFVDVMRSNAEVPGLVLLYSALAVEAADPAHAAHAYFRERRGMFRAALSGGIRQMQADGDVDAALDPDTLATAIHALADGLQVHSLIERDLDMARVIEHVVGAMSPRDASEEPSTP